MNEKNFKGRVFRKRNSFIEDLFCIFDLQQNVCSLLRRFDYVGLLRVVYSYTIFVTINTCVELIKGREFREA